MPLAHGRLLQGGAADQIRSRLRLAASLALSLALHFLLLQWSGPFAYRPGAEYQGEQGTSPLTVTLTMRQEAPAAPDDRSLGDAEQRSVDDSSNKPAPALIEEASSAPTSDRRPDDVGVAAPPPVPAVSGPIPGPWYFPARWLHVHPSPLRPISPVYPAEAESVRGRVLLLLLINEHGDVDDYRVVESEPPGIFDSSVIDAFGKAKYSPGIITGYPVRSQLMVEVTFEPGATPSVGFTELPR